MATRGMALIVMALGSLILLGISSWLLYNDESVVGWVMFTLGVVPWTIYVTAVVLDIRQTRRG